MFLETEFLLDELGQTRHYLHIIFLIHRLTWWNKFFVNDSQTVEERDHHPVSFFFFLLCCVLEDSFCGLVVRVPGYRSDVLGSIPGAAKFFEK
jgi:hypothetical protein